MGQRIAWRPGAGDEFVAALALAPAWDVGRRRQARKVVTREKSFGGKAAVRVKILFVNAFGFGQQADLAFGFCPQAAGAIALCLRTAVVANDFVMDLSPVDCGSVKSPPAIEGRIEAQSDFVKNFGVQFW